MRIIIIATLFLTITIQLYGQHTCLLTRHFYGIPFMQSKEGIYNYLTKDTCFINNGTPENCIDCRYQFWGTIKTPASLYHNPDSAKIYSYHPIIEKIAGNIVSQQILTIQIDYYFQSIESANACFNSIVKYFSENKTDTIIDFHYEKYPFLFSTGKTFIFDKEPGKGAEHKMTISREQAADKHYKIEIVYEVPKSLY